MDERKSFEQIVEFLTHTKERRAYRKKALLGGEVIRISNGAQAKLIQMHNVTELPKKTLASYAIYLLFCEFEDWFSGKKDSNFGYDEEVILEKE